MLRFLSIRRLAVIDRLEVELEPGLNLITGETGAGKSVVVQAIDLLAGARASADLVRTGEDAATVQAVFERPDGQELVVRREVSAQGRSRAFIDDALATSASLRDLGRSLIDLHGQHEHQTLLDPAEHLACLDAFIGHEDAVEALGEAFDAWRAAATALDRARLADRDRAARLETLHGQIEDIDRVKPVDGEDEALAAERSVLANADRLARLSSEAYAALYDGDDAVLPLLGGVWKRIADLAVIDARFAPYLEHRAAVKSSLEDLAFFLRSYETTLDAPAGRLEVVETRAAQIDRLKKRYGPTLADVLATRARLGEELDAMEATARLSDLEEAARAARDRFLSEARAVSAARRAGAVTLARDLARALADLAMPHARVDLRIVAADSDADWSRRGIDHTELLLSPNPGEEPRPLARIASGGELSRVLLALRTLGDDRRACQTLVFDEVDAGVGGAAADAVGARLQQLARRHQVLCITHLPQIAAREAAHFRIAKEVRDGRTLTALGRLDAAGREHEIARMIAGDRVSPDVLASARALLHMTSQGEGKSNQRAGRRRAAPEGPSRGA
jgi:DNA repair protein RecN (Recombination protein N)